MTWVHENRTSRLRRRAVILLIAMALLINLLILSAAYNIGKTGWAQFVFRSPGTGATPDK